jgi:amino acid efflux transporter
MYVAAVLGPGVLSLPGLAERAAGPSALIAWGVLIVLSWPMAETFGRLGARHPGTGGVLDYCDEAFGSRCAVAVGRCFWFAIPVGTPAAAVMAGEYVGAATGGGRLQAALIGIALTVIVAAVNLGRVTTTARLQLVLTGVLAVFLVLCVAGSLSGARTANLHPFVEHGGSGVVRAIGILVWGFAGWEALASLSGSFRSPRRDLVPAARIAVTVVGLLYAAIAVAVAGVLGAGAGATPMAALLERAVGPGSAHVAAAAVSVALTASVMNAYFAGAAKLTDRLVAAGGLPAGLACPGPEPARKPVLVLAGLCVATIAFAAVARIDLSSMVSATSALLATVCLACVCAAWRRSVKDRRRVLVESAAVLGGVVLVVSAGWFLVLPALIALTPRRRARPRDR